MASRGPQGGRRAARAEADQIMFQGLHRTVHATLEVGFVETRSHYHSPWTTVAVPRPSITSARFPGWRMLKTTIGILLSRHSATAEASTARRPAFRLPMAFEATIAPGFDSL